MWNQRFSSQNNEVPRHQPVSPRFRGSYHRFQAPKNLCSPRQYHSGHYTKRGQQYRSKNNLNPTHNNHNFNNERMENKKSSDLPVETQKAKPQPVPKDVRPAVSSEYSSISSQYTLKPKASTGSSRSSPVESTGGVTPAKKSKMTAKKLKVTVRPKPSQKNSRIDMDTLSKFANGEATGRVEKLLVGDLPQKGFDLSKRINRIAHPGKQQLQLTEDEQRDITAILEMEKMDGDRLGQESLTTEVVKQKKRRKSKSEPSGTTKKKKVIGEGSSTASSPTEAPIEGPAGTIDLTLESDAVSPSAEEKEASIKEMRSCVSGSEALPTSALISSSEAAVKRGTETAIFANLLSEQIEISVEEGKLQDEFDALLQRHAFLVQKFRCLGDRKKTVLERLRTFAATNGGGAREAESCELAGETGTPTDRPDRPNSADFAEVTRDLNTIDDDDEIDADDGNEEPQETSRTLDGSVIKMESSTHVVSTSPTLPTEEGCISMESRVGLVVQVQVLNDEVFVAAGKVVWVFDVSTSKVSKKFEEHAEDVTCFTLKSAEPSLLFTGCGDAHLRVFQLNDRSLLRCIYLGEVVRNTLSEAWTFPSFISNDWRISCMVNGFGKTFVGLCNGLVQVISIKKLMFSYTLKGGDGVNGVTAVFTFHEGSQKIVVIGCEDKCVYLRDFFTGVLFRTVSGLATNPRLLRLSAYVSRGSKLFLPTSTGLFCYDAHHPTHYIQIGSFTGFSPSAFALTADDSALIGGKGMIIILSLYGTSNPGNGLIFLTDFSDWVTSIASSGTMVYYGYREGGVKRLDISSIERHSCGWASCQLVFARHSDLRIHLHRHHLRLGDKKSRVIRCLWGSCNQWLTLGEQNTDFAHLETHLG